MQKRWFKFVVMGGGILGVSIAYWISSLYDCSVALVDKETSVARHTSSRNTGVIHRPFYLNPNRKKLFAMAAQKSYFLWKDIALKYGLPWIPVGTLEVATSEDQMKTLESYSNWSEENGMTSDETQLLDGRQVTNLESQVRCLGAIFSKNDTCVNYEVFTNFIFKTALKNGIKFFGDSLVDVEKGKSTLKLRHVDGSSDTISADFVINATGGGAVQLAHKWSLAKGYADLFFRGEYWRVEEQYARRVTRNIYSVPKYKEFPFLDPHFIIRANGKKEIGPNAVLVFGPWAYKGLWEKKSQVVSKIFEKPLLPKLNLFTSNTFLSLVWHEWRSSLSKEVMCNRVKEFLPTINSNFLRERGIAGVRSSVIDRNGFVPEALLIEGDDSLHILNYNSPGATGAPAYSAYIVSKLIEEGRFDGLNRREPTDQLWKFEEASNL